MIKLQKGDGNKQISIGILCGCLLAGASTAFAQIDARVDTNGILKGYTVQESGRTVYKALRSGTASEGRGVLSSAHDLQALASTQSPTLR